jgi:hypothetical protein
MAAVTNHLTFIVMRPYSAASLVLLRFLNLEAPGAGGVSSEFSAKFKLSAQ